MFTGPSIYKFCTISCFCVVILSGLVFAQVDFRQHDLPLDADRAWDICTADIDGDGDEDFLTTGESPGFFVWYEVDEEGDYIEHIFHDEADGACSIRAADIDGDGDMDITGSARGVGDAWWWENDGEQNFEAHILSEDFDNNSWMRPIDLDGDGDVDIVGSTRISSLLWWENDGEQNFDEQIIDGQFGGSIEIIDFDGDEDLDITCGDWSQATVRWYENDGEQNFEPHQIGDHGGVWDVYPADFDADGDMDITSVGERDQLVIWWENGGDDNFERHDIEANMLGTGVHVGDLDVDGDSDIIVAAYNPGIVKWYENDGEGNFEIHIVGDNFNSAMQAYASDVDFDGDLDVMAAAWSGEGARWWENTLDPVPPEPEIDPNPFEVDVPFPLDDENIMTITNVGDEGSQLLFNLWDEGDGIDWLSIDPVEGIVEFDEFAEIVCTFSTEDLEPGEFERTIIIRTNAREFRQIEVPVTMNVIVDNGELRGTVTDLATEDPIEGARISVERFDFQAVSDEDGVYVFDEIPEWIYTINIEAEDYLSQSVEDVEVIEDEVTILNFDLSHSVCELSIDNISEQMAVNEALEIEFTLSNPGNGPLEWSVNRVFPEGMEADPWDHRLGLAAGDNLENNRLGGIEVINGNFYVAGGISDGENLIYVINEDGEVLRQIAQFGESRYGYRDIAYDGNLIWGIDGDEVHGFTIGGELEVTFRVPIRSARGIAWDRENDLLWISSITSDIFGTDRNGEVNQIIERPGDLRTYGLSCYPDDPDDFKLYMFCSNGDFNRQIHKLNIETGEFEFVVEPEVEGTAGACTVTRAWDPFSWVFTTITNSPDRLEIWHLDAPTGWVDIEPSEGVIEAENQVDMTVQLNTFAFPEDIEFTVDLVFAHNGVGGESVIPVSLLAGDDGPEERVLVLVEGWNMVSTNVVPQENNVTVIMEPLVENGLLELLKNGIGRFYNPEFNFNNIWGWVVNDGYMMKVTEDCQLSIIGIPVEPDLPIELDVGWQLISYYPRVEVDAVVAFSGIAEVLEIAKDGSGRFYSPEFGFSNMGDLREGSGYMVKTVEAIELVYAVEEELARQSFPYLQPSLLPNHPNTGENMSLLVHSRDSEGEVGVYSNGHLVGSGIIQNGKCGIAVWGDDPTTPELYGAISGAELEVLLHDGTEMLPVKIETMFGELKYTTDGFSVLRIQDVNAPPEMFGIVDAFPNPFNSTMSITYNLLEESRVSIALFDLAGRQIKDLTASIAQAGQHTISLEGAGLSSGVYVIQLQANGQVSKSKVTLVK